MKRQHFFLKESYDFLKALVKLHHLLLMTSALFRYTSSDSYGHTDKNFSALTQLTLQHCIIISDQKVYIGCLLLLRPLTFTSLFDRQPSSLHYPFNLGWLGSCLFIPFGLCLAHGLPMVFQNQKMIVHLLQNTKIINDFCKNSPRTYYHILHQEKECITPIQALQKASILFD